MSRAVLFDLDGTLVDSAPDLAAAANHVRALRDLPPLPTALYRPMTGAGARGLLGVALGLTMLDDDFETCKQQFLDTYERNLAQHTRLFEGMDAVLRHLEHHGQPWGIVTNKAERFVSPLLSTLDLHRRASVVICGDTTPRPKPAPDPLLEAARCLGLRPQDALYVGDDLRDIQAGHAAHMPTIAAAWGYLGAGESIDAWGAAHIAHTPADLLPLLKLY
ncbi:MAG: phosphoglycolate phosphatase [Leptothrix ochracea]|uniref:phosphoglycolate phosphatase n=1 Tax=Leptothrix ochracea TaxID=735331 RepID=UPI0034E2696F